MSRLRSPFLYDRYISVTANLHEVVGPASQRGGLVSLQEIRVHRKDA